MFGILTDGNEWIFIVLAATGIQYHYVFRHTGGNVFNLAEHEGEILNLVSCFTRAVLPTGVQLA